MDIRSDGSTNVGTVDIAAQKKLQNLYGTELLNYLTGCKKYTKPLFYLASLGSLMAKEFLGYSFTTPYADADNIARNLKISADIMEQLRFQPGMVTNFFATDVFVNTTAPKFTGVPFVSGNEGTLTMLIIGARRVDDEFFFLLQTWDACNQFVEVSAE